MIDQSELVWFITSGIAVFERSTMGDILDRLDRGAHISRECPICDGHGIILDATKRRNAPRLPWVSKAAIGDWCLKCNGVGQVPMRLSPEEQAMVDSGEWGSTSDNEGQRTAVPDQVLVRYANVSRILNRMPGRLREALTLAYGDEGEELAATMHGRSWACSPLTLAGAALLRQERERRVRVEGIEPEMPIRCLTALANLNGHKSHPERTKALAEAANQAQNLLVMAEAAWNNTVESEGRKHGSDS